MPTSHRFATAAAPLIAALAVTVAGGAEPVQEPACAVEVGDLPESGPEKSACLLQQGSRRMAPPASGPASLAEGPMEQPDDKAEVAKGWRERLNEPAPYEDAEPRQSSPNRESGDAVGKDGTADGPPPDVMDMVTTALAALGEQPPNHVALSEQKKAKEQHKQPPPPKESVHASVVQVRILLPVTDAALDHPPLGPPDAFLGRVEHKLLKALNIKASQIKVKIAWNLSLASVDDVPPFAYDHIDNSTVPATHNLTHKHDAIDPNGEEHSDRARVLGQGRNDNASTSSPLAALVVAFDAQSIEESLGIDYKDVVRSIKKLLADTTSPLHVGTIAPAFHTAYVASVKVTPLSDGESPSKGDSTRAVFSCLALLSMLAVAHGAAAEEP